LGIFAKKLQKVKSKKANKYFNVVFEKVRITDFAAEGKALCRIEEMVVFVKHAAPGDVVDLRISKTKRNYMEGVITHFHEKSAIREDSFCEHFGVCGGCKWQHLKYENQLEYKQKQVIDSIERIGKIPSSEFEIIPIAGSETIKHYRNKLEYTFTNRRWLESVDILDQEGLELNGLGFHVPGFYDKVMNINNCYLQPEPSNSIRLWIRDYSLKNNLEYYDLREHTGWLRNVIIRNNLSGDFMVNVIVTDDNQDALNKLLDNLSANFPQITSLFYTLNPKKNSSISDLQPVLHNGLPYLEESMEDIKFRIGPNSFFQTNSKQANTLYSITRDFADLKGDEIVYDLYTGAGTIACFVASKAKKVVGIEYVEEAIIHAKENAENNSILNTEFYCGDMAKILTKEFILEKGKPDVIITDPPRAGMHPDVVKQISLSGADKIVYVSCNPATQARDIEMLNDFYRLEKIQAVDMFPHTQHVESVALLVLRK
jgi:23S rRNA (uracil1939-C5)-methyltransferase